MKTENDFRELSRKAKNLMLNGRVKAYFETLMQMHSIRSNGAGGRVAQ